MKMIKCTHEARAYTEEEAMEYIRKFKEDAITSGYTVGNASYTYKPKKSKGVVVSEGWLCKCTKIVNEFWDEGDLV